MRAPISISSSGQSAASLAAFVLLLVTAFAGCGHRPTPKEVFQTYLEAHKQEWFDNFHPIGKAKRVQVHDVIMNKGQNGTQEVVRFTIYWEGPITKDGFTKIRAVHDWDTKRFVRAEILETNGTTNAQVIEGIAGFVNGFLEN